MTKQDSSFADAVNLDGPELSGLTLDIYRSALDQSWVIHVDTDEDVMPCNSRGPTNLRVYINDDRVYINDDQDNPAGIKNPEAIGEAVSALEEIRQQAGAGTGALDEERLGIDGAAGDFEWIIDRARAALSKLRGEQA